MSKYTVKLGKIKNIFGYNVDTITYGLDRACGYFIQGELNNKVLFNQDSYGFGLVGEKTFEPLGNYELADVLIEIGCAEDAEMVMLDLEPRGKQ